MSFEEFQATIGRGASPPGLDAPLLALWHEARGDWARAHECVQNDTGPDGCWVHAYLHRKEGDLGNAGYWYARAGRNRPAEGLDAEWAAITRALLAHAGPTATDA